MSETTADATAMPGVRSSSTPTRPGSTSRRAACRYSSARWADTNVPPTAATHAVIASATVLPARKLRSVIVGRVAIDRVDVLDAALRRVLDHQRRPLNPEVRGAAVRQRTAPGKVRLCKVCSKLRHARLAERVVDDTGPLLDDFPEKRLLRRRK